MRTRSHIAFDADTVSKSYRDHAATEFEKSLRLWEVSQRFGFVFPKPLRLDSETGTVEFSRVPLCRSIRADYLSYVKDARPDEKLLSVFRRSGEILGIIHRELSLPDTVSWQPPACFIEAARKAGCPDVAQLCETLPGTVLHGDYGLENIERDPRESGLTLAVFDASPNYFVTFAPHETGPVYIDIGNFLSVLFGLVPFRHYPFIKWARVARLQSVFIEGYRQESPFECDQRTAMLFSYATASCYLKRNFSNPMVRAAAMWVLFNPIKRLEIT